MGPKDQQSPFVLPRVGTKSTRKSAPSRPGSGLSESQNMGGREEISSDTEGTADSLAAHSGKQPD